MTREEMLPIVKTIARLGPGDEAVQQLRQDGLSEWDSELALVCVSTAFGRALLERMEGGSAAQFSDKLEIQATSQIPARTLYFSRLPQYTAALALAREYFEQPILPKDEAWELMTGSAEAQAAKALFPQGPTSLAQVLFTSTRALRLEGLVAPAQLPPAVAASPKASPAPTKKPWWKVW
jgi:hypothetical protein